VLDRPCPECGFDASTCRVEAVPGLVRENAIAWQRLVGEGRIRSGRTDPSQWSSLEYTCHMRDVLRRIDTRIDLMLTQDDPLYASWDQDASAVDDRYDEQDPKVVITELTAAADALAARLDRIPESDWQRPGRRSDGASFTVATISCYMLHESVHHLRDVAKLTS